MIKKHTSSILPRIGGAAVALLRTSTNVVFWTTVLTVCLVSAAYVYVIDAVKAEPRLIGVVVYLIIGAWIAYSLLFGVGTGLSRIPAGF